MSKQKIGWGLIAIIAIADFVLLQHILLESNAAPMVAVLAALIFVLGLECGPAFAGMGLASLTDKTKIDNGSGNTKSTIYMVTGVTATIITFAGYIFIRRDSIIAAGGFGGYSYPGFYGDLILLLSPIITSLICFAIGLWIATNDITKVRADLKLAQEKYDESLHRRLVAGTDLHNTLSTVWNRYLPDVEMPLNYNETINILRAHISNDLENRLNILLPNMLSTQHLVEPLVSSTKELLRTHVDDENYLSLIEISCFDRNTNIGKSYAELDAAVSKMRDQIISAVSNNSKMKAPVLLNDKMMNNNYMGRAI